MDLNKILAVTYSGMRPEEEAAVKDLIHGCELPTGDLSTDMLRHFIVARKGDRVIGVIGLEINGQEALLRSLAVVRDYRGQGIASRLADYISRYAADNSIRHLYLLTATAEGFFIKQGYRKINRNQAPESIQATREFRDLCPDTAVCMHRQIQTP